ncbi:1,6-anhydro-N-acetylmuramyl-L-alanine amidase AmpD [Rodentibacter pneumotropicus]|uniref:1,6-anhydro-N-acetylmuramyl-L-alanine amidase AmpD n=1 Tax=Rodentibacter pneumotropicus TaxID=758 RepID=UPI00036BEFB8|nr:1,6-anhydro-N-acetylmuramyl-L-alanine amidase AmpD [Rodentibacter pneumotropicus]NBH75236.1 1,6-anhydro-N-acetylmuramyl-L-alanine amidase AmpD [Rodentibacter pneumotropicus]OOF63217.1 N-acetyl-anhydromuranmyl-L-alanine amidase [Rodentibacter pneumotropicus]THA03707.1 1,6-anhydro-N-acetylmuramyl-L-alanine amidase AmpD [Rodentibacter pneumotropicus]THA08007.1 1,6-anhydro-N-acetylmuramyl-L-alanine amidase AmpD [Rodentibacter pneumotropicus]THA13048.1 1,6-anhydro-N-acetylmuramyl-L-alanine amida
MKKLKCIEEGWLKDCRQIPSEYFDERPDPKDISLLVIHYISLPPEQFGGGYIDDFFQGKLDPCLHPYFKEIYQMSVSAHCLIDRCGVITQYVNFNDRAWHAGISSFEDRERCNDFSIGIELEGSNELPFTDAQYEALQQLTACIMSAYPDITLNRIVGHSDISPGRKIDPGQYFDWERYLNGINSLYKK